MVCSWLGMFVAWYVWHVRGMVCAQILVWLCMCTVLIYYVYMCNVFIYYVCMCNVLIWLVHRFWHGVFTVLTWYVHSFLIWSKHWSFFLFIYIHIYVNF